MPSPPLNLSCVSSTAPEEGMNEIEILSKAPSSSSTSQLVIGESDSSSDVVSLPEEFNYKSYVPSLAATNFRQALASLKPPTNGNQTIVRKRKTLSNIIIFSKIAF